LNSIIVLKFILREILSCTQNVYDILEVEINNNNNNNKNHGTDGERYAYVVNQRKRRYIAGSA
jgi:hypothetical protein